MYGPAVCRKGFLRVGVSGLASMYPASDWSGSVLRAIMDISARSFSLADRPHVGHAGHQGSNTLGRPILHLLVHSRRPRGNVRGSATATLSSPPFPGSIGRPFPHPDLHIVTGDARRGRQGWPAYVWCVWRGAVRPCLDGPEHVARLRRFGTQHRRSSSSRSRGLWPAPPRQCARACWPARWPARCGADASWPPQSTF